MLSYQLEGDVAVISFDDGRANAYSLEVIAAHHAALARGEAEASAVVLVGRAGRFSAGFDLSVMRAADADRVRALVSAGIDLVLRIFTFPMPTVAACTGHALAAGASMLLACDHRVGLHGSFKIGLNEVAIGMRLPVAALEPARYRMPPSAFDSTLLGRTCDPFGAVTAGYLDRVVVDAEDLLSVALAEAKELATLDREAVRVSKRLAREAVVARVRATVAEDMADLVANGGLAYGGAVV